MKKHFLKTGMATLVALALLQSCKKDSAPKGGGDNNGGGTDNGGSTVITPPNNPDLAATQGFFLDGWQAKTFATPAEDKITSPV